MMSLSDLGNLLEKLGWGGQDPVQRSVSYKVGAFSPVSSGFFLFARRGDRSTANQRAYTP